MPTWLTRLSDQRSQRDFCMDEHPTGKVGRHLNMILAEINFLKLVWRPTLELERTAQ